jgi:hypothetical protein
MTLTSEQYKIFNAYAAFGADHFVNKVGKNWRIAIIECPKIFKTRKAAIEYVELAINLMCHA